MKDKKKFCIKLLKWYDANYSMSLFDSKNYDNIVNDFLIRESKVSEEAMQIIINDLSARRTWGRSLSLNESRRKMIRSLFIEGYSVNDFFEVHRVKVQEWANTKESREWLYPETLYKSDKFQKYLEQAEQEDFEPAAKRIKSTTLDALSHIRNQS